MMLEHNMEFAYTKYKIFNDDGLEEHGIRKQSVNEKLMIKFKHRQIYLHLPDGIEIY